MSSYRRRIASVVLGAAALGLVGGGTAHAECQYIPQDTPAGFFVIQVCAAEAQDASGNPDRTASIPVSVSVLGSAQGALFAAGGSLQQGESTWDSGKRVRNTSVGPSVSVVVPAAISAGTASLNGGVRQQHTTRSDGSVRSTTTAGGEVTTVVPPVATSGATNVAVYFRQVRDGDACSQELAVTVLVADMPQSAILPLGDCAAEVPELPQFP